jgi:phospholipid/cholesterol/gamma-HCH transport system substrate-binding protein
MQSAAKVGLLLVVFIGLLIGGYAVLGRSLFGRATQTYYADFSDASGIAPGTQVLMAGVKVGSVGTIRLVNPKLARMSLLLDKDVQVPTGTVAMLPSSLIGLGSSPVELTPPAQLTGGNVRPGSVLPGRKGGPLDNVLPDADKTVAEFTKTLTAVRKLLEDQRLQQDVKELIRTSTTTIDRFGKLANNVNYQLATNQASVQRAIIKGTQAVADVQQVTAAVVRLVNEGKIQGNVKEILAELTSASRRADQLVANMNKLVTDPSLPRTTRNVADITETGKSIAANVNQITETGKAVATNTEAITRNGVTISQNAITLTEKANVIADNAIEIEKQLQGVLERIGGFFTRRPGTGRGFSFTTEMDLIHESDPGRFRTDLSINIPTGGGRVNAGFYDAFESNKLILQYGKDVTGSLGYRYGIYGSKPAVGVDYQIAPRAYLRTDLWDINNARFDARLRYEFGNGLVGWVGMDRIFRDNAPTFGIGIRR